MRFSKAFGGLASWFAIGWVTSAGAQALPAATPNEFLARGVPTFILGTAGNEREDRDVEIQARMVRDLFFPNALIQTDISIDPLKGAAAWPKNPVLYGGPHMNQLLARLAPSLPFKMEAGKLVLGREIFEGEEYRLITVVPGRARDSKGPGYPEFLLYAGTGSPGVGEINAVRHGADSILIADRFGRLLTGKWQRTQSGEMVPHFPNPRARRIPWRFVRREVQSSSGAKGLVDVGFPEQLPPGASEEAVVAACGRGVRRVLEKLQITNAPLVTVYIYPDRGSKRSLTQRGGDAEADIASRSIHTVKFDPEEDGPLEHLIAHEATHVIAYEVFGAAGTALLGEGLAVWLSGRYGGTSLETLKKNLAGQKPGLKDLLGRRFNEMPEQQSYPLSGLFVDAAINKIGLQAFTQHLLGATSSTWESACKKAGTTSEELEAAWHNAVTRK